MAGCTPEQAPLLNPILDVMAKQTLYLGQTGTGAVMKLSVNPLIHGLNQTLAEALPWLKPQISTQMSPSMSSKPAPPVPLC